LLIITLLAIFLIGYGIIEYQLHLRYLRRIPIRVHVNGTRGKSSVTRLISAGLRSGNLRAVAKTTGTSPCMIYEDGKDRLIHRLGKANIKEQMPVIRKLSDRNPDAMVIECMALQPILQKITEHKLVQSTVGVITNVRPDHLDVMGPTVKDVAIAFSGTIPKKSILFTSETDNELLQILKKKARSLGSEVKPVAAAWVTSEEMSGFSYFEWKDNVSLALTVCQYLGVERDIALQGMYSMTPDPGALKIYRIEFFNKIIEFANGFAANDPESTILLSKNLGIGTKDRQFSIFIVNCRADKIQRSEQLAELIAHKLNGNRYVLTGTFTRAVYDEAIRLGIDEELMVDLGGKKVEDIFEAVVELAQPRTIVVGIGNMVGLGDEIVNYFSARGLNEFGV